MMGVSSSQWEASDVGDGKPLAANHISAGELTMIT